MSTPHQEPTPGPGGAAPATGSPAGGPAPGGGAAPAGGRPPAKRGRSAFGAIRLVLLGAAAVILVVFAFVNLDPVPVDYLFGQTRAALILVIAVSALLGAIVGAAAVWRAKS